MTITLQDVSDRITRDCLNRPNLQAEAIRGIQAAIRYYERERWPWNETTVTLTAAVATSTLTLPTDFLELDLLEVVSNGIPYEMTTATFADVRRLNAISSGGMPTWFAIRGYDVHVAPLPDSAYPVVCHYRRQLPELSSNAMTASNKWLSACSDLIVWHAAKLVWSQTLRNTEESVKCAALEKLAYSQLEEYRAQRASGRLSSNG